MIIPQNTDAYQNRHADQRSEGRQPKRHAQEIFHEMLNSESILIPMQREIYTPLVINSSEDKRSTSMSQATDRLSDIRTTSPPHVITLDQQSITLRICSGPLYGAIMNVSRQGQILEFKVSTPNKILADDLATKKQSICETLSFTLGVDVAFTIQPVS